MIFTCTVGPEALFGLTLSQTKETELRTISNINLIELMTRDKIMYAHNMFICYENNNNVLYLEDIF